MTEARIFNMLMMCRINGAMNLVDQYSLSKDCQMDEKRRKQAPPVVRHFKDYVLRNFGLTDRQAPEFRSLITGQDQSLKLYIRDCVNAVANRKMTDVPFNFVRSEKYSSILFLPDGEQATYGDMIHELVNGEAGENLEQTEIVPITTMLSELIPNLCEMKIITL